MLAEYLDWHHQMFALLRITSVNLFLANRPENSVSGHIVIMPLKK